MPDNQASIDTGTGTSAFDTIALVLREMLNIDDVSPDDDFFALGGHSMQILRLISELRTTHGLDLPVRQFGTDARIGSLAAACRVVRPAGDGRGR